MEESSTTCVLCEKRAMMLCDSDQAKLCWECDEKVHSANFLVAKHSRVLLCRLCHSPTPWKASGMKLTPTVSFCNRCVAERNARWNRLVNNENEHQQQQQQQQQSDFVVDDGREYGSDHVFDDDDGDYSDDSGEEEEEDEDDEEENENQVVPMSSGSATSPPKVACLALKRLRNNSFSVDSSHDETACSSSEMLSSTLPSGDESTSLSSVLKRHRVD
ncbi:hypothetical protein AAZX31_06G237000 [Glycine max]|uniref:B box-type domain-containing protein n=2 Tax=Glycine subgen. Soja TaxID=1462606 RepID=I1KE57_SOYBN|nr:zinc finger protein CONSTANS-LIKE 3 [Glycine max]XP_028237789.1 zinc finger protein CONSTANS-LIKE 3-like [Glycine soja]KAG5032900.1 hypothetical protein JHK85_016882 [Glycine max]KAG5047109.1 hypothetical protein JHK86_016515 [Glycine max]KAG5149586.1 hypothetical protein JHK82_016467 [Glycine max]KAH1127581.1 hypothetical protein GYH30_016260 [Glycine max]KHN00047.1 Zinc finger protein CONSTANS-LIKE 10 [Glycine soja]|eukprot:XP_003527285.1 zinc finger protein CONSTANS-LIKE 3 [Glycine max]